MEGMETRARPRRVTAAIAIFAAGLVAGTVWAALGVAGAQTTSGTAADTAGKVPAFGGRGGPGHGMRGALHGEFTTAKPGGGYQRLAVQTGEVTDVSNTSITVRSEDGYSRKYIVDENTSVNAGRDGISDVSKGDTVHVTGIVDGNTVRAVQVGDRTRMKELRSRWLVPKEDVTPGASGTGI